MDRKFKKGVREGNLSIKEITMQWDIRWYYPTNISMFISKQLSA